MKPLMFIDTVFTVRFECCKTWSSSHFLFCIYENFEVKAENGRKKLENIYMRHIIITTIHISWQKRIKVDDNLGSPSENVLSGSNTSYCSEHWLLAEFFCHAGFDLWQTKNSTKHIYCTRRRVWYCNGITYSAKHCVRTFRVASLYPRKKREL